MGKRQHQKDKMYITCTEWTTLYGGRRDGATSSEVALFKRLPFDHCSLSLLPFEHPLCSAEGHIFDLMSIVPYLKKFASNPVTGKPLDAKSLFKLNFSKNAEGEYHCPVLFKTFTLNSHIVAVRTSGNVFCNEAIEQLNIKTKHFKDLLTDEPFTRSDLITIQDPGNLQKFNLSTYYHLQNNLKVNEEEIERAKNDKMYFLKAVNAETKDILETLEKEYKPAEKKPEEKKTKLDKFNAAHYSTGMVAAGFTSTVMEPTTVHESAIIDEDLVRYSRVKKKGYVRLMTSHGQLNLELHCDIVAKTCENFIKLCNKGYYNNTVFHRSIRNFMIQGGDPTGTGGESAWGGAFKDEFKPNLSHTGRGILSMANSGPDTNKSQFFITYRSCKHLDNKHTIFGRVVGGLETLTAMEYIETDKEDKPKTEIRLLTAQVFVDPFDEADEQLAKEREAEQATLTSSRLQMPSSSSQSRLKQNKPIAYSSGVGKYINPAISKTDSRSDDVKSIEGSARSSASTISRLDQSQSKKKKLTEGNSFKNFSGW